MGKNLKKIQQRVIRFLP